jgi:hypothetical protein
MSNSQVMGDWSIRQAHADTWWRKWEQKWDATVDMMKVKGMDDSSGEQLLTLVQQGPVIYRIHAVLDMAAVALALPVSDVWLWLRRFTIVGFKLPKMWAIIDRHLPLGPHSFIRPYEGTWDYLTSFLMDEQVVRVKKREEPQEPQEELREEGPRKEQPREEGPREEGPREEGPREEQPKEEEEPRVEEEEDEGEGGRRRRRRRRRKGRRGERGRGKGKGKGRGKGRGRN